MFLLEAVGTIFSIEKAVHLVRYRGVCPDSSGMLEINVYDTSGEDTPEGSTTYTKDGPSLITL